MRELTKTQRRILEAIVEAPCGISVWAAGTITCESLRKRGEIVSASTMSAPSISVFAVVRMPGSPRKSKLSLTSPYLTLNCRAQEVGPVLTGLQNSIDAAEGPLPEPRRHLLEVDLLTHHAARIGRYQVQSQRSRQLDIIY